MSLVYLDTSKDVSKKYRAKYWSAGALGMCRTQVEPLLRNINAIWQKTKQRQVKRAYDAEMHETKTVSNKIYNIIGKKCKELLAHWQLAEKRRDAKRNSILSITKIYGKRKLRNRSIGSLEYLIGVIKLEEERWNTTSIKWLSKDTYSLHQMTGMQLVICLVKKCNFDAPTKTYLRTMVWDLKVKAVTWQGW